MPAISPNKPYRIGRSRTGLGLFATKPIRKGTKIIRYFGPLLDCRKKKDDAIEALESNSRVGGGQLDVELAPKLPADEQFPVRPLSGAGGSTGAKSPLEILEELPDSETRPVGGGGGGKPTSPPPPGP